MRIGRDILVDIKEHRQGKGKAVPVVLVLEETSFLEISIL